MAIHAYLIIFSVHIAKKETSGMGFHYRLNLAVLYQNLHESINLIYMKISYEVTLESECTSHMEYLPFSGDNELSVE